MGILTHKVTNLVSIWSMQNVFHCQSAVGLKKKKKFKLKKKEKKPLMHALINRLIHSFAFAISCIHQITLSSAVLKMLSLFCAFFRTKTTATMTATAKKTRTAKKTLTAKMTTTAEVTKTAWKTPPKQLTLLEEALRQTVMPLTRPKPKASQNKQKGSGQQINSSVISVVLFSPASSIGRDTSRLCTRKGEAGPSRATAATGCLPTHPAWNATCARSTWGRGLMSASPVAKRLA